VPKNITPIFLPSRAPELNPVENSGSICCSQTPSCLRRSLPMTLGIISAQDEKPAQRQVRTHGPSVSRHRLDSTLLWLNIDPNACLARTCSQCHASS
jgi:hypothetical protein